MTPSAGDLLAVWEAGRARHPLDRALVLLALAAPETPSERLADMPLGVRNEALLRLRRTLFGPLLQAYLDCPACAQRLEFELDVGTLLPDSPQRSPEVEVAGHRFRLPTTRDLACVAGAADVDESAQQLLQRCQQPSGAAAQAPPPAALLERVAAALEQADPAADTRLELHCESCGHAWQASFDVAAFLWDDLESCSARWLDEVHWLASAYGWSEAEILALSEARRNAYLERVLS